MTATEGGTLVNFYSPKGVYYYMSPGCSVTETVSLGIGQGGRGEGEENNIYLIPADMSHVIRVDATILKESIEAFDGLTVVPQFAGGYAGFVDEVISTRNKQRWLFKWGSRLSIEGFVKSITGTQRSGEGDLMDLSVTFEVGDVAGG